MLRMRRIVALMAVLMMAVSLVPGTVLAARPAAPAAQVLGLEITYVPPGVEIGGSVEGGVGTQNVVIGTCGWASMWVTDVGVATAKFEAAAGSSIGIIVRADWLIDWVNVNNGAGGAWSGTTWQLSPTWGVNRTGWTGAGLVYGTLRRLVVTHANGVICTGLVPWDWEQVT